MNLGLETFMAKVTQIAVVETKQAIWDYDPQLEENKIANRTLDAIAIIRTLAVKVCDMHLSSSHASLTDVLTDSSIRPTKSRISTPSTH